MKYDSNYARLKSILNRHPGQAVILVSRRTLQGLAEEMEEVARQLARHERDDGSPPVVDLAAGMDPEKE